MTLPINSHFSKSHFTIEDEEPMDLLEDKNAHLRKLERGKGKMDYQGDILKVMYFMYFLFLFMFIISEPSETFLPRTDR